MARNVFPASKYHYPSVYCLPHAARDLIGMFELRPALATITLLWIILDILHHSLLFIIYCD